MAKWAEFLTLFRFILGITLISLKCFSVLPPYKYLVYLFFLGWATDTLDGALARKVEKRRYYTPITDEIADYSLAIASIVIFVSALSLNVAFFIVYAIVFSAGILFKKERVLMFFVAIAYVPLIAFYFITERQIFVLILMWLLATIVFDWDRFFSLVKTFLGIEYCERRY